MLAKELHSSPWTWKAGHKGQMPDAASALSWRESIEEVAGMTPLITRGTDTCPWKDSCSVFYLLNEADAGHMLPAHL